jgi:hypothetical protein
LLLKRAELPVEFMQALSTLSDGAAPTTTTTTT